MVRAVALQSLKTAILLGPRLESSLGHEYISINQSDPGRIRYNTFNNIINCDLVYVIPHASETCCRPSCYSNKSS